MTSEQDVVLIHFEDKPLFFARIEEISPDVKPNWYQVRFLVLQVPLQSITWILREAYIDGVEFTMNGKRVRVEKVTETRPDTSPRSEESSPPVASIGNPKVISLADKIRK